MQKLDPINPHPPVTSKFNSFLQDQASVPTDNSLVIQNNLGVNVASFSNSGTIYTKGKGIYNASQAGCQADGTYCNGVVIENRDYYIKILFCCNFCNALYKKSLCCLLQEVF